MEKRDPANPAAFLITDWERWAAGGAGAVLTAVGAWAALASANQAGAAALVLTGGALLVISLQGVRLADFGGSAAKVSLAKKEAAINVLLASVNETDPVKAEAMVQAAAFIDASVSLPAAHGTADDDESAFDYEDKLHAALGRWSGATAIERDTRGTGGEAVSFVIKTKSGREVVVETNHRPQGPLRRDDLLTTVTRIDSLVGRLPVITVTNAPQCGSLHEAIHFVQTSRRSPVAVVTWNGDDDNPALLGALNHLAGEH